MSETEEREEVEDTKASRDQKNQSRDLDKVTDFAEDKESIDANTAQRKLRNLLTTEKKDEAQLQRERELASVSIKQEDIDLIVGELEITKQKAEVALREHKGDVVAALRHLIAAN
eukprot:TRINITY_DN1561_c0_g1_i1.p1 TRINITY_DN1561_c0_g1~~TRINITY_DN1561_c0_g1_i1.p1  ORF type:complete len:115 (-),score=33.64 TRINITY_DN1561_c0_g1_i1:11-355(-)